MTPGPKKGSPRIDLPTARVRKLQLMSYPPEKKGLI